MLKATLPEADGTAYDVAFIDSGHVEKCIHNLGVLQQLATYVKAHPNRSIIFPSSFSGKTVDIMSYLSEHTTRAISVDAKLQTLLEHYDEDPENIWPNKAVLQVRHKQKRTVTMHFILSQSRMRLNWRSLQRHIQQLFCPHRLFSSFMQSIYFEASLKGVLL